MMSTGYTKDTMMLRRMANIRRMENIQGMSNTPMT